MHSHKNVLINEDGKMDLWYSHYLLPLLYRKTRFYHETLWHLSSWKRKILTESIWINIAAATVLLEATKKRIDEIIVTRKAIAIHRFQ